MVILSIIMSIFVGIQDPIIQKFAIRIAGGIISSKTGVEIQIGQLYISPNFTIHINHFLIKDQKNNDLLSVKELKVRPMMEEIVHGNYEVARVELKDTDINLITYEGEESLNLQFLLDLFPASEKKDDTPFAMRLDRVLLKDLNFQFWDQNKYDPEKSEKHLMDYSHLIVNNINLDAEDISMVGDSITATIHRLAASESCGFELKHLQSNLRFYSKALTLNDLTLETSNSDLHLDLELRYDRLKCFNAFMDSVTMEAEIRRSNLEISDLGPFSEILYEMPNRVSFEGHVKGPGNYLTMNRLKLNIGDETRFEGNLAMHPTDFKKGYQKLNIKKFHYTFKDLANFRIPGFDLLEIPVNLAALEKGEITGSFNGTMDKFKAEIDATSEVGNIYAHLNKYLSDQRFSVLEGTIEAKRVNVGEVAKLSKTVGKLDLSAEVIARQTRSGDLDLDIDGGFTNTELLGNNINEISLNGNLYKNCFNGKIKVDDDDLNLDFTGRFDFSNPKSLGGSFQADIQMADLHKLNLVKNEETAMLSALITADVNGINNFHNAEGFLSIKDLHFVNSNGILDMNQFDGSVTNDLILKKRIGINCDFFDVEIAGQMDFNTLGTAIKQYLYHYVTFPQWAEELEAFEKQGKSADQDFIVQLNLKDPKPITRVFMPKLSVAKNTSLNGTFTTKTHALNLTLRSKYLKFNKIKVNDIECRSTSSPRRSSIRLGMSQIILRDSTEKDPNIIGMENFSILSTLQNDSIRNSIFWENQATNQRNQADIHSVFVPRIHGGWFNIDKSSIILNDTLWAFNSDNFVEFDQDQVRFSNLYFHSDDQALLIDGVLPMEAGDTLSLAFQSFDLSTFNFILYAMGLNLNGNVYGKAAMSNLRNDMTIIADIDIKDLAINGEEYGEATLFSQWNNENRAVEMDLNLLHHNRKTFNLSGNLYTERKEDNLDFTALFDSLNFSILSPFLKGVLDRLQGQCYGGLTIGGSFSAPDVQGRIRINEGGARLDLLNTFYTFSPTLILSDNLITLEPFSMTDTLGQSASVTGNIKHQHFKDFLLDIHMFPTNFLAMNTQPSRNSAYYGTVFASGTIDIIGSLSDIDINIEARTQKGTFITLPLGGNTSVKKHDFITFVTPEVAQEEEDAETEVAEQQPAGSKSLDILMNLHVNNNATVKISLPNNLGSLEAKGDGNLRLGLPSSNAMTLVGEYVISEGGLSLVLQEIIRRNFSLQSGSSISWTGDPVNGTIDATGIYQTKAALSSLGLVDSTAMSSSNAKVECLVHLQKKLMNPDISFSIRLPGASEDLQQAVFNIIDTTNQSEMFQQTLSLLIFNAFSYGANINGYGILTSQLNDLISQMVSDIDINFNFKPGSEISNEEVTLALKKQFFDDRLTIETNFGVIRPTAYNTNNSTNIVGDVNIDYKITKDGGLSAQVFNRSNFNTYYYQYTYYKMAPYTQGIGLSYSKSFERLRDLFRKRNHAVVPNRPLLDRPTAKPNNDPKPAEDEPNN